MPAPLKSEESDTVVAKFSHARCRSLGYQEPVTNGNRAAAAVELGATRL